MDHNVLHSVGEIIRALLVIPAALVLFHFSLPRDVSIFALLRREWPTDETPVSTPTGIEESPTSLEQVSRIAIIVIGTLYSIGLFIVNMKLGQHGLFQADLARPEYIMAGTLWAFLAAISIGAISVTRQTVKRFASDTRKVAILKTIITILAVGWIYFYVLEILSKSKLYLIETSDLSIHWPGVGASVILLCNGGIVPFTIEHIRNLIRTRSRNLGVFVSLDLSDWNSLYALVLNLSLIAGYATIAYPLLAREYGGGTKPLVEIGLLEAISAEHLSLHLPISDDGKILGPVRLVLETDKMLFVDREQSPTNLTALFVPGAVVGIDKARVTTLIHKPRRLGGK